LQVTGRPRPGAQRGHPGRRAVARRGRGAGARWSGRRPARRV